MAVIVIVPVETTTKGGFTAKIEGINPTDHDFIEGTVSTPALGAIKVRWNGSGICRNMAENCNIDPNDDEVRDVVETVRILIG